MSAPRPGAPRALLFDLDGTLYRQDPLRLRMLLALARLPVETRSPKASLRVWRAIQTFRSTRETLRTLGDGASDLERRQYRLPAEQLGMPPDALEAIVHEWIDRRPLPQLRRVMRPELPALLEALAARGIPAGVFSDYPAVAKLAAMGLAGRFDPVLAATDAAIHAFKPHPAGLLHAAALWDLPPAAILYVGDRPEVDAAAAAAAGMPCAIVGDRSTPNRADYLRLTTLTDLIDVL
ncbi:MAG: HAD family hydrolase [Chloroflexi bacterium]|nr:HAD family hydrolase [Chloroflexota bacterium]